MRAGQGSPAVSPFLQRRSRCVSSFVWLFGESRPVSFCFVFCFEYIALPRIALSCLRLRMCPAACPLSDASDGNDWYLQALRTDSSSTSSRSASTQGSGRADPQAAGRQDSHWNDSTSPSIRLQKPAATQQRTSPGSEATPPSVGALPACLPAEVEAHVRASPAPRGSARKIR